MVSFPLLILFLVFWPHSMHSIEAKTPKVELKTGGVLYSNTR